MKYYSEVLEVKTWFLGEEKLEKEKNRKKKKRKERKRKIDGTTRDTCFKLISKRKKKVCTYTSSLFFFFLIGKKFFKSTSLPVKIIYQFLFFIRTIEQLSPLLFISILFITIKIITVKKFFLSRILNVFLFEINLIKIQRTFVIGEGGEGEA